MAGKSPFRSFITALEQHWRHALPQAKKLAKKLGPLPAASSFAVGKSADGRADVYLWFQTHRYRPGSFTINVIKAVDGCEPTLGWTPGEHVTGSRRIGEYIGAFQGDKWWSLQQDQDMSELLGPDLGELSRFPGWWYPTSYDDNGGVIRAAVADVTSDVIQLLKKLQMNGAPIE